MEKITFSKREQKKLKQGRFYRKKIGLFYLKFYKIENIWGCEVFNRLTIKELKAFENKNKNKMMTQLSKFVHNYNK